MVVDVSLLVGYDNTLQLAFYHEVGMDASVSWSRSFHQSHLVNHLKCRDHLPSQILKGAYCVFF